MTDWKEFFGNFGSAFLRDSDLFADDPNSEPQVLNYLPGTMSYSAFAASCYLSAAADKHCLGGQNIRKDVRIRLPDYYHYQVFHLEYRL